MIVTKEIQKRYLKSTHYSQGVTCNSLCLSLCATPHILYSFFLLILYLLHYFLCGNYFLQSQKARVLLLLTIGLVANIYCFHHFDPAQAPTPSHSSKRPSGIIFYFNFSENSCMIICLQASLPVLKFSSFQVKHLKFILNFLPFSTSIIQSISNFFFCLFLLDVHLTNFSLFHAIL